MYGTYCNEESNMNGFVRLAFVFIGGVIIGAVGSSVASRHNGMRPMAVDVLSKGMDVRDALLDKAENIKENVEGFVSKAQCVAKKTKA